MARLKIKEQSHVLVDQEEIFKRQLGNRLHLGHISDEEQTSNPPLSSYNAFDGHIQHLFLRENLNVLECPEAIQSLTELVILDICGLDLWDFDRFGSLLKHMVHLENLHISNCKLKRFPEWVCDLPNLHNLVLDHNQIRYVPRSIKKLNFLSSISFWDNKFNAIPSNLRNLSSLVYLDMDQNRIAEIPAWMNDIPNLRQICLRRNKISEIPASIFKLKQLQSLYLDNNRISYFLDGIVPDRDDFILSLKGNPLTPFFEAFCFSLNYHIYLRRFNNFIPKLIEKIRINAPLDQFDIIFPFYGKYRGILEKEINENPTDTAQRVKKILETGNQIISKDSFPLLL